VTTHPVQLPLLPLFAVLLLPSGCDTSCDAGESAPIPWAEGRTTVTESGSRIYESTPLDGTWLHFPSGRRFSFAHGLGTEYLDVESYLSFRPRPFAEPNEDPGSMVAASGNLVVISESSAEVVTVRNDTCENDYYLFVRIVAR